MIQKSTNCPGKKVHDYIFVKQLGKGAFGEVYSARNIKTNEIVAIKCIPRSKLSEHNGVVGQLLNSEVEVLQQVSSPHVVKLLNYLESQNQCYIVLEFCNSGDFEQLWISKQKKIPENEAIDYMKQILAGMQALHEKNVLHRDLKLANILIHNQTLKIADLGFSKQLNSKDSVETLSLGSLGNMAPEVVEQKPYGMAADMFSIGSIFYQLLFGCFPFSNANQKAFLADITNNPPNFNRGGIRISSELQGLIAAMLRKDPRTRLKWQELYSHPLLHKKDLKFEPLSIGGLAADQIDAEKLKKFYDIKENNYIPPQPLQKELKQPNQIIQIEEQSTFDIADTQLLQKQEEDIAADKEVTLIVENYMSQRNQIVFLAQTLNEVSKVKHANNSQGMMPQIMLSKKMSILSQQLIHKILNKENIYKTRYLDLIYQNKFFLRFQEVLMDDSFFQQDMLKYYIECAKNNQAELIKHIQREWLKELKEEPSENFQQYFNEVMNNYFFVLNETRVQEKDYKEKELILNLQIHLVDGMLFDKLVGEVRIQDVSKKFDQLLYLNMEQKQQLLDKKTQYLMNFNFQQ